MSAGLSRSPLLASVALLVSLMVVSGTPTMARAQTGASRRGGPKLRARPPAKWDSATESHFFADAFAELDAEGPRPDFARLTKGTADAPASSGAQSASPLDPGAGWSAFISADTLVDEIKQQKKSVDEAVAKKSQFMGGGYQDARDALSSIAAAFGVIAAYSGEVRWKNRAAVARDAFARVAADCTKGDDAAFAAATKAAEDLQKLLSEGAIEGIAAADVKWHRIAARPPLMKRLELAERAAREATASSVAFDKAAERFLHEAELIAMIGEFVQQPDFEFFDDDTYRGYATAMRDAAGAAVAAARRGEYDSARTAIGAVSKACTDCHGEYR